MGIVNLAIGAAFDILFLPFRGLSPWFAMIFISLLTAFLMLWIFKLTSNQAGIHAAKNAIKAHLLELRLYKDNMRISLRAQGRIVRANGRYIAANSRPLLVMIVPLLLILAQLNLWFGAAPLEPGAVTIVKVKVRPGVDPAALDIAAAASGAITLDSPAVRIADESEIDWRIRAAGPGPAAINFTAAGKSFSKPVAVGGTRLRKVSPLTVGASFVKQVLYPGEKPISGRTPVREIEVVYPSRTLDFLGLGLNWLVAYFILSIIFGFAFKGVFKVEI